MSLSVDLPNSKPLSAVGKVAWYGVDLAASAYRLVGRRVRRTREIVEAEYDERQWGGVLRARSWERSKTLADFLVGNDPQPRLCKIDGTIVRAPTRDYYRYRLDALRELITSLTEGATEIVELGCGSGDNLFTLSLGNAYQRYLGFDISENGVAAGGAIAKHFNLSDRMIFDRLDLTNAADENFKKIAGRTAFTYFCVEQLPYSVEAVVANILAARPRRIINIEPTVELLDLAQPRDIVSYLYIKSVDYQTRLFTHLEDLARQGTIRILKRMRMPFAPTIHNDGFIVVWEPIS